LLCPLAAHNTHHFTLNYKLWIYLCRCHCPIMLSTRVGLLLVIHFIFKSSDVSPILGIKRRFRGKSFFLGGKFSRISHSWTRPQRPACNVTKQCLLKQYIRQK
jgi:hypothetical protein